MKCKLLRYNKEPLELNMEQVSRISAVSQSNISVCMNTGETHLGYLIKCE